MIRASALSSERDTSSCDHCSEKGATVRKAAPPIIPSMPSFFMIDLPDDIAMDGGDAAHRPPPSQRTATLASRYLARRYRLYAEPRPAPTCGLVLMNSSSVSLSIERVCSVPSQFGNVLAVNFSVKVCFSSSTV